MLMKSIALVMSLMLLLCGSAASEQLGATNSGGGGGMVLLRFPSLSRAFTKSVLTSTKGGTK